MTREAGRTMIATDARGVLAAGHAAWHHGDGDAAAHWAIEVAVDPADRTQALWREALAATVGAIPAASRHVLWGQTAGVERAAHSMGYRPVRRLSMMQRVLPTGLLPQLPPGLEVAGFVVGRDEDAWLRVNNAAFKGHPENGGLTRAELSVRTGLNWFRPEDLRMAWQGEVLVGSCWTKRHASGVGEIYVIGVDPEFQGRGLGRSLTLAGLDHLATTAGCTTAMLYVDDDASGARQLYESLGFQEKRAVTMYAPRQANRAET
jgi:mycothiol synthase